MEYRLVDNKCIARDPGIKHTHRRIADVEDERGCPLEYVCASVRVCLINERGGVDTGGMRWRGMR